MFVRNWLFDVLCKERLTRLGTTSLSPRRVVYDQNLVHRIANDHIDIDKNDFLIFSSLKVSPKDIHSLHTQPQKPHSKDFQESFITRVVKAWNELPSTRLPKAFNFRLEILLKQEALIWHWSHPFQGITNQKIREFCIPGESLEGKTKNEIK